MEKNLHSNTPKPASSWSIGLNKDALDGSDFYITERQIGRTVEMISFALKCGNKRAFPVTVFDEIKYRPETGICLYSRMATIIIMGRNLNPLYELLISRRVKEVKDFCSQHVSEAELFIESITIHSDYDEH